MHFDYMYKILSFLVFISFAFFLLGFSSLFADCISEIWHFSGSKRLFDFGDLSYHTTTASAYYIYTMTFLGIHILVLNVWFLQDIFPHFPCLCIACIFFFGKCGRSGHGKRLPLFLFFMLSPTPPPSCGFYKSSRYIRVTQFQFLVRYHLVEEAVTWLFPQLR